MRSVTCALAAVLVMCCISAPARGHGVPYLEDDPAYRRLHFVTGEAALSKSEAELTVPPHSHAYVGIDDDAYDAFESGGRAAPSACTCRRDEAEVRFTRKGSIRYRFFDSRFVTEAYRRLDFTHVLRSVIEAENRQAAAGWPMPYRTLAWTRRPVYDRASHTMAWDFRIRMADGRTGELAQAIVLSRFGYETLEADARAPAYTWPILRTGLAALRFPVGLRYQDATREEREENPIPLGFVTPMVAGAQPDSVVIREVRWWNFRDSPYFKAGFLFDVAAGAVALMLVVWFVVTRGRRKRMRSYGADGGFETGSRFGL